MVDEAAEGGNEMRGDLIDESRDARYLRAHDLGARELLRFILL